MAGNNSDSDEGYELIDPLIRARGHHGHPNSSSHAYRPPAPLPTSISMGHNTYDRGPLTPASPLTPSTPSPHPITPSPLTPSLTPALLPDGSKEPPPLPPPNPIGRKFHPLAGKPVVPPPVKVPVPKQDSHSSLGPKRSAPPPPPKRSARSKTIAYPKEHDVPPIPPKPLPSSPSVDSLGVSARTPLQRRSSQDYILLSDELTLQEFVARHKDAFPVSVRVCKGFYGPSERTSVSEGDSFNIHFLKSARVVNIDDCQGFSFKIALNSAIEFGIVYDPGDGSQDSKDGLQFERVSDILAMRTLPKAVRATKTWKGSSPESSVEENELLFIKGSQKKLMGKLLKVYSPLTCKKKELPENCVGHFSTKPYEVKLYLPEIVEHVINPFPIEAVLFVSADTAYELPTYLMSGNVTLRSVTTEMSLIATNLFNETGIKNMELIDIPFSLDIEVQVLRPKDEEETEQLYEGTRYLYEQFDPTRICSYMNSANSDTLEAQTAFYTMVREGSELAGLNLIRPASIGDTLDITKVTDSSAAAAVPAAQPTPPTRKASSSTSQDQHKFLENRFEELQRRLEVLESAEATTEREGVRGEIWKVSRDLMTARVDQKRLEGRLLKVLEEIESMRAQVTQTGSEVARLQQCNEELGGEVNQMQQHINTVHTNGTLPALSHSHTTVAPSTLSKEETIERNKTYLSALDCLQIAKLLDLMGLGQHRDTFLGEQISGEILLECDEDILEKELRVSARLHRVRLMKVVLGQHSAEKFLSGEDPYVFARK